MSEHDKPRAIQILYAPEGAASSAALYALMDTGDICAYAEATGWKRVKPIPPELFAEAESGPTPPEQDGP